jgi:hypothetical protein
MSRDKTRLLLRAWVARKTKTFKPRAEQNGLWIYSLEMDGFAPSFLWPDELITQRLRQPCAQVKILGPKARDKPVLTHKRFYKM